MTGKRMKTGTIKTVKKVFNSFSIQMGEYNESFNNIKQKLKEFSIDVKTDPSINTNEKLKEIEMNIGKQLPCDYKDFLKEYGGCDLESKKQQMKLNMTFAINLLRKILGWARTMTHNC